MAEHHIHFRPVGGPDRPPPQPGPIRAVEIPPRSRSWTRATLNVLVGSVVFLGLLPFFSRLVEVLIRIYLAYVEFVKAL